MSGQETHTMKLIGVVGKAEEWYCPSCGRRFLLEWNPHFRKRVIAKGDENAIHTGGKGISGAEICIERPNVTTRIDHSSDELTEGDGVVTDARPDDEDKNVHLDFTTCTYYEEPFKKFMKGVNLDDL